MIKIREAIIKDFDILSNLDKHINANQLKNKIESKEIFVLLNDNKIIGYLRYNLFWDEHPFMNMLFLLSDYRKMGFGKKIVSYWEQEMKEKGYKMLMLSTLSNEDSQHFYRKLGYKDIGGFIMPKEPLELIMFKEISNETD